MDVLRSCCVKSIRRRQAMLAFVVADSERVIVTMRAYGQSKWDCPCQAGSTRMRLENKIFQKQSVRGSCGKCER